MGPLAAATIAGRFTKFGDSVVERNVRQLPREAGDEMFAFDNRSGPRGETEGDTLVETV